MPRHRTRAAALARAALVLALGCLSLAAQAAWTRIAGENETFTVDGLRVVRFGVDTRWVQLTVLGGGKCDRFVFGSDPAPGVGKTCEVDSTPPVTGEWRRIANEWQVFETSTATVVRFGAGSNWIQRTVTGAAKCDRYFFGSDPAPGVGKACESRAASPATTPVAAQTVDSLVFGNAVSEASHRLATGFFAPQATVAPLPSQPSAGAASDTLTGVFGLTARRLLPRTPNGDYYGGEMSFTMAVDPVKLNHFTVKTWGSDVSTSWLVLEVEGLELGWRHDYLATDEMMFHQSNGWYPGGFVYRTVRLPHHLTSGKRVVKIKLRSLGEIRYYAGGSYDNKQTRMRAPTVPIYSATVHTGAQPDLAGERQGVALTGTVRSPDDGDAVVASWKSRLDSTLRSLLTRSPASLKPDDLQLLAQSYSVAWSAGYRNPAVVAQVRDAMDTMARAHAAAPASYVGSFGNDSWGGYLGGAGEGVRLLKEPLRAALDATVDFGGSVGTTTRRQAWGLALRASVDHGRSNRLGITNQVFWAAWRTYLANRGLLEIQPSLALKESEARRYLYEAAGLEPWRGNDAPGGGDTPVRGPSPYGPDWFMVTSTGTSKEDCLVGGDYGEIGGVLMRWAVDTGDERLQRQAVKMLRARAALARPGVDGKGARAFLAVEAIGCRNSHEMNWHVTYLGRSEVENLLVASLGPAVVGNDLIGYAQQAVADGQLYSDLRWPGGSLGWSQAIRVPEYHERFKALAPTGVRLPMSEGQPDFSWADHENMAIAARRGEERFWAVLNWRGAVGMNRLARVFVTTPQHAFIAEVGIDDVQYTPAGRTHIADGRVEGYSQDTPPDRPVNANNGQPYAVALRPGLAAEPPTNRDAGRADAYTLRYGRWLVGLNAHPTKPYTMRMPVGFTGGTDLVTGRAYGASVTVGPRSHVVFYLPSATEAAVSPANPLQLRALGAAQAIALAWETTPGAASYRVSRADSQAGPYSVVADQLLAPSWVHAGAGGGWYRVQALDGPGNASGTSPAVAAAPAARTVDAGWASTDVGRVPAPGSGVRSAAGITMRSAGLDIWSRADSFQYVHRPLVGDGSITVRVASQVAAHPWARAGVMIRESLDAGARHASMMVTAANGAQLIWRSSPGGGSAATTLAGRAAPSWLRLTRSGSLMSGEISADGRSWTRVGQVSVGMAPLVYIGLAATSARDDTSYTAVEFDNLAAPDLR